MRRPTPKPPFSALPAAQGLYDPSFESDACGVAFVADLGGVPSHRIVSLALTCARILGTAVFQLQCLWIGLFLPRIDGILFSTSPPLMGVIASMLGASCEEYRLRIGRWT